MHTFEHQQNHNNASSFTIDAKHVAPLKHGPIQTSSLKYAFDINVFLKSEVGRNKAEHFIVDGFKKAYNADISVTMPWILAINNGRFKAALGIRPGNRPLFLEQYLTTSIENVIELYGGRCSRKHIAEIGHLYSNATKFTLPLFLTTAVSLFYNHFEYMVFSATEHVLKLIANTGISFHTIAEADPTKLLQCSDNWGSYYTTHPKVVVLSLSEVMQVINRSVGYSSMFNKLSDRIANASSKIQGEYNVKY